MTVAKQTVLLYLNVVTVRDQGLETIIVTYIGMSLPIWSQSICGAHRDGNCVSGYVDGETSLEALLQTHQCATTSTFLTRTSTVADICQSLKEDSKAELKKTLPRILFQCSAGEIVVPFDGTPFCLCGRKQLECQFGPSRLKSGETYLARNRDSSGSGKKTSPTPDN